MFFSSSSFRAALHLTLGVLRRAAMLLRDPIGPCWAPDDAGRPGHDDDGVLTRVPIDLDHPTLTPCIDRPRNAAGSDGPGQFAQASNRLRRNLRSWLRVTLRSKEVK